MEAARPLLPLLGLASPKIARGVAERRGAAVRLETWGGGRDPSDPPVLWLHGASAGELLGAAPVLEVLRTRRDVTLLVTYFSPSGEATARRLGADAVEVLPPDTFRECRRAVAAVAPAALVFAKLDVWPNLTRSAASLGVPLALVNGTVRPDSSRLRWPVRRMLRPAYRRLDAVGAVSREDGRRLVRLGAEPERVRVTGDAAFDEALERARRAARSPGSPAARLRSLWPDDVPVLVAGSTWREDESLLIAAAGRLLRRGTSLALVLVPHDPTPEALGHVEGLCRRHLDRGPRLWSRLGPPGEPESGPATRGADFTEAGPAGGRKGRWDASSPRPLVVDEVGVLAGLYGGGDLAWVGGGFGDSGLHSVVEPAAAGVPVLFGPRGTRREAEGLVRAGGGFRVSAEDVTETLASLLRDRGRRREAGRAARAYVEAEAGAARRNAALVLELLEGGKGGPGQ